MGIRTVGLAMSVVLGGWMGVAAGADTVRAETLTIGATHSLKPAFEEIVPMFEREYGAAVNVLYGSSATLRRQIEAGQPIDVFIPAVIDEVTRLHKKGLTLNGGPRVYAQTSFVLVMSAASPATPVSLDDAPPNHTTRIALEDPRASALGAITIQALATLDPAWKSRSRFVYAQHGEEIMNLVHAGKADVGLVYRADAINNGHMRIIDELPAGRDVPAILGGAVVSTCRKSVLPVADAFLGFMTSPRIQKLLLKYGFDPVPANGVTG